MAAPEKTEGSLAITLFGPMQALVDCKPLPNLRSRKGLWLLALLALHHGRPLERAWLVETLWPELDQDRAFANLRPILSELRNALGRDRERLESPDRHTLRLNLSGAAVDLIAFDTAIQSNKPSDLELAVALYRGALLEGCAEEWVIPHRYAREQACLKALLKLGDSALAAGNYGGAIGSYQHAATLDPWGDAAQRGWMEALAKGGDRNAAMQVYQRFVEVLRSDPEATPDEQTRALYVRLRAEAREPRRAPVVSATAASEPVNTSYLPLPLTDLIGRENERVEVAAKLLRSRLVTLTGIGGIGKTRLALEVAREVVGTFADGVWLVGLETLPEGSRLVQQIASVLGVREEPGRPLLQSMIAHLRKKRLLLVLDNCEHLLEASAQVVEHLLRECAGIRILATSREALRITGETAWAVPALAVPDSKRFAPNSPSLPETFMGYESVRLFVERAQAVVNSFALTDSNARTVAEICTQLEGIPLALELAAARIKAMTIEQISTRLHNELSLLTRGNQAALSRQQTLRATLDWSYGLLSESERLLLQRLAVFVGGWNLRAAESVCCGQEIEVWQVVNLLTSLVDKSLVVFEAGEPDAEERYRLLEMVRQYAVESLQASGGSAEVKARHREWYVALAEEAEPLLRGAEQYQWLRRLATEYDNLRAALTWEGTKAETALRLAGALYRFWYVRGYWSEGREHLGRTLGHESAQARTATRAKALHGAGALAYSQGDYASARALHEESLSIHRELGDREGIAWALNSLGNVAYDQGDYASARALHEESLKLRRELGDGEGIAWSLNSLGNITHPQGDYAAAESLYTESLHLFRQLEDRQGIARSLSCLGFVAFDQGNHASARTLFEESLSLARELEDRGGIAWSLCCLGYVSFDQGAYTSARAQIGEGHQFFNALGDRRGCAWALNSLGNIAYELGDYASARTLHEESLKLRRELGDRQGIAWSLICQGRVLVQQEDYATAQALLVEGLGLFGELQDKKGVAESLRRLGALFLAKGEFPKAVRLLSASHALQESLGASLSRIEREKFDREVQQTRSVLSEEAFTAAWEEGSKLAWEQVALAV